MTWQHSLDGELFCTSPCGGLVAREDTSAVDFVAVLALLKNLDGFDRLFPDYDPTVASLKAAAEASIPIVVLDSHDQMLCYARVVSDGQFMATIRERVVLNTADSASDTMTMAKGFLWRAILSHPDIVRVQLVVGINTKGTPPPARIRGAIVDPNGTDAPALFSIARVPQRAAS